MDKMENASRLFIAPPIDNGDAILRLRNGTGPIGQG